MNMLKLMIIIELIDDNSKLSKINIVSLAGISTILVQKGV